MSSHPREPQSHAPESRAPETAPAEPAAPSERMESEPAASSERTESEPAASSERTNSGPEAPSGRTESGSATEATSTASAPERRQVVIRRAPKFVPFLLLGALLGLIAAGILAFTGPGDSDFSRSTVLGFLSMVLLIPGLLLGALAALALDWFSVRRSERAAVEAAAEDESEESTSEGSTSEHSTPEESTSEGSKSGRPSTS